MAKNKYGLFTREAFETLMTALYDEVTEAEAIKYMEWCTKARVQYVVLKEVLKGELKVTVREDGEPKALRKRTPEEIDYLYGLIGGPLEIDD